MWCRYTQFQFPFRVWIFLCCFRLPLHSRALHSIDRKDRPHKNKKNSVTSILLWDTWTHVENGKKYFDSAQRILLSHILWTLVVLVLLYYGLVKSRGSKLYISRRLLTPYLTESRLWKESLAESGLAEGSCREKFLQVAIVVRHCRVCCASHSRSDNTRIQHPGNMGLVLLPLAFSLDHECNILHCEDQAGIRPRVSFYE